MLKRTKRIIGAIAVVGMAFVAGPAIGQTESNRDSAPKSGDKAAREELPDMLQSLNLSDQQKKQIREINQQFETRFETAWKKFHRAHLKTVATEAAFYAAVEDQLDERQKQRLQEMRKKESSSGSGEQERSAERAGDRPERRTSLKPNIDDSGNAEQGQKAQPQAFIVYEVTVIGSPKAMRELGLTNEQQQQCDQACQKYKSALRRSWRTAHQAHRELVQIEAEKLQQIEKVLTKEQLRQIHGERTNPRGSDSRDGSSEDNAGNRQGASTNR